MGSTVSSCRNHKKFSEGQFFVTGSAVALEGLGIRSLCRDYSHPRDASYLKGVIGRNTKIGTAMGVLVTNQFDRYGVEIKIDSLANDGSQSWVVISRGVERYVTEIFLDCTRRSTSTQARSARRAFVPRNGQQVASSSSQQDDALHSS